MKNLVRFNIDNNISKGAHHLKVIDNVGNTTNYKVTHHKEYSSSQNL